MLLFCRSKPKPLPTRRSPPSCSLSNGPFTPASHEPCHNPLTLHPTPRQTGGSPFASGTGHPGAAGAAARKEQGGHLQSFDNIPRFGPNTIIDRPPSAWVPGDCYTPICRVNRGERLLYSDDDLRRFPGRISKLPEHLEAALHEKAKPWMSPRCPR